MPNLTAQDMTSRKGWAKDASEEDDSPGEKFAGAVSGRNRAGRALYNATRGDTIGEMFMGRQASEKQLKRLRDMDAKEAEEIDKAVPRRRKSPLYDREED